MKLVGLREEGEGMNEAGWSRINSTLHTVCTSFRVSIPCSVILPAHKYKAHRRSSFDPSDGLGLPSVSSLKTAVDVF